MAINNGISNSCLLDELKQDKSAFGETVVVEPTPVMSTSGVYNHVHENLETFTGSTGNADITGGEIVCTTGAGIGGYGVLRTKRAVVYKPGQGVAGRWTARFPVAGVANSLMFGGMFTSTDGFYIGYSGTTFACMHEYGGAHEIRKLTISAAASGTESLTIEVNGVSHTFNVTSGTAAHNAYEIEQELNANIAGWKFYQNGDTVVGYFTSVGAKTGTYSFTNNSAGTCAASWSQINQGATTTRDVIPQSDWNGDKLPVTLDPSKGNVYQVKYQYLGYGDVKYYIENSITGQFVNVHTIRNAGVVTAPTVTNPALKIGWTAASLGSTTELTVAGASGAAFIEGKEVIPEDTRAIDNKKSISTTETNIMAVRDRRLFNGKPNQGEIQLLSLVVSNDSSKGAFFRIYFDPTLGGTEPNWQYEDETNSIMEYDFSSTTVSGGRKKFVIPVAGNSQEILDLQQWRELILPDQMLVVTGEINSGAASDLSASFIWREDV